MKACSRELKQRCSNLGAEYSSKVSWVRNVPKHPSGNSNGDAEHRLHVYVGRHAGPEILDRGYGNPFVIGQNPQRYQAFYTDVRGAKGGGKWPRAGDCLALYRKHADLIRSAHEVFRASGELDEKGCWTRDNVIELFWIVMEAEHAGRDKLRDYVSGLLGKRIACYCQPEACHAHLLRNVFCQEVLQSMDDEGLKELLLRVLEERRMHELQRRQA